MHSPILTKAFECSTNVVKRRIVQIGTKDGAVSQADATSDTTVNERPIGIAAELGAKTGETVDIHLAGVVDCEAGASIVRGATVKADSIGRAVPALATNDFVIGMALVRSQAAGDIIQVLIAPQRI